MENLNLEVEELLESPEKESFCIDSDYKAEWAVEKIKNAQAEYNRMMDILKHKEELIKEQMQKEKDRLENSTSFLKYHLYSYFNTDEVKAKVSKTKTQAKYRLPSGDIGIKFASTGIAISDEATVLNKLKEYDMNNYIKTKESVAWKEYKATLKVVDGKVYSTETGEEVEGIAVETKEAEFFVK